MAILEKKYQRPSQVNIGGNGVGAIDKWLIVCDAVHTRDEIVDWFFNVDPDAASNPVPGVTGAFYFGRMTLCEDVDFQMHPKSRKLWIATARWTPPSSSGGGGGGSGQPVNQPSPLPKDETVPEEERPDPEDPDTWDPVVQRRCLRIEQPYARAFYIGGFAEEGTAHTRCIAKTDEDPPEKQTIVNSAFLPIDAPNSEEIGSLWIFRFTKKDAPDWSALDDFEDTVNETNITLLHNGLVIPFVAKTAWCKSIELSETRIANKNCWEIEIEIMSRISGFDIYLRDQSFYTRALEGDDNPAGGTYGSTTQQAFIQRIVDRQGNPISVESPLNGDGKIWNGTDEFYGQWRYQGEKEWSGFPLIQDLIAPES